MIELELERSVRTWAAPSRRVCEVAAMFGLGVDERRDVRIVPRVTLRLGPGRVVFVTGASGGGKTALLRLVGERLGEGHPEARAIDFDRLGDAPDAPLVDALAPGADLGCVMRWLSLAGLNDAFVMLRRPDELSDGQRYRFRLARAMAMAETWHGHRAHDGAPGRAGSPCHGGRYDRLTVILADEFGATLDRVTARVIGRNARKWVTRSGVCLLAATTHDDLLEPLAPDTLIVQNPGEETGVVERPGG